jgi:hypothetical protein
MHDFDHTLYDPWSGDALLFMPSTEIGFIDIISVLVGTIDTIEEKVCSDVIAAFEEQGFLEPDTRLVYVKPDYNSIH